MNFRANENTSSHVEAYPSCKVPKEVITAAVIGTVWKETTAAGKERRVKADRLSSNSGLKFGLRPFADWRSQNSVEIVENWPVGLREYVDVLIRSPGDLAANADILSVKKEISRKRGVAVPATTSDKLASDAGFPLTVPKPKATSICWAPARRATTNNMQKAAKSNDSLFKVRS